MAAIPGVPAPPGARATVLDRIAHIAAFVTVLAVLAMTTYGAITWTTVPAFPAPAANESLLVVRRGISVVLGICGITLAPFAAGAGPLRMVGAVVAGAAAVGFVFAAQAYRDLSWAPALNGVAGWCALTAVLLVAAGLAATARR